MTARDVDPVEAEAADPAGIAPEDILVVRFGPGANCSSIGSALDVLFLSAVAGSAILVAVAAAMPAAQKKKAGGSARAGGSAGVSGAPLGPEAAGGEEGEEGEE